MRNTLSDSYYLIEKFIQSNAEGKNISKEGLARVIGEIGFCGIKLANELLRARIKKNPKLKGKIDDCWLTIFCVGVVAYTWSSAVSRGKAFDRKRDGKGRLGWMEEHDELPLIMSKAYYIGEEIVNQRLMRDGDFNNEVELARLTKNLMKGYSKK